MTSELDHLKFIAGGARRICEIAPSFRNEPRLAGHSVEFPLFEAYSTDHDTEQMCGIFNSFMSAVLKQDVSPVIMTFGQVFERALGFDYRDQAKTKDYIRSERIAADENRDPMMLAKSLFYKKVTESLPPMVYIINPPSPGSPLIEGDRETAKRLWLFVEGIEVAEIAQNCVDHNVLRDKLEKQFEDNRVLAVRDYSEFLNSIANGLPRTVGIGAGVHRIHDALKSYATNQPHRSPIDFGGPV